MKRLPSAVTLVLFVLGILIGAGASRFQAQGSAAGAPGFDALPLVSEPQGSAAIMSAVSHDDARSLAQLLDGDTLKALGDALDPVVEVTDVQFTGAVASHGQQLAGYVVHGHDAQGTKVATAFVLRVEDGKVVGVN